MPLPDGHPQAHRLLSHYHASLSAWHSQLAAYHWQKHLDPLSDLPIPLQPDAIHLFQSCDYHGFCRAAGIPCLPACPLCAEGAGAGQNQSGG